MAAEGHWKGGGGGGDASPLPEISVVENVLQHVVAHDEHVVVGHLVHYFVLEGVIESPLNKARQHRGNK